MQVLDDVAQTLTVEGSVESAQSVGPIEFSTLHTTANIGRHCQKRRTSVRLASST
jgi:hypothetical protein